jgi:dCTP deaminase
MTVLADFQIRALCETGMVTPFDPALVNAASLDLRLGSDILIESAEGPGLVPLSIADYTDDDPYRLVPGQFVHVGTLEAINLPLNLVAQFVPNPHEGLQHLHAGFCQPGSRASSLTLGLKNTRQLHWVGIWPGMRIGQLQFLTMDARPLVSYAVTGRYNADQTVTASRG